jgi:glycosyltransferase involved in cell wall biosynthesis
MKNSPKVSILIPTHNRAKIILETLNCAVNQTYKNTEIIVVDNKSTDNSYEIIKNFAKSYPNVRAYQNEENIGPVRNWRRCLDYATGEYAKILWSDDLIAPDFIEKTLPYLEDHEDVGFVFTGTEIFNDDTGQKDKAYFIGETGIYDTGKYIESSLLGKPLPVPVSPGNALFRKKELEKNLILDVPNKIGSDFKMHAIGNDALIYLLTAKDYPRFAFVNETLASFRAHNDSITISSDSIKLTILYNIAKAYFVENYISDIKLRRKFNARVFVICLKNMFTGKYGGVTSVRDFYLKENNTAINGVYFLLLLIKWVVKRLLPKRTKDEAA